MTQRVSSFENIARNFNPSLSNHVKTVQKIDEIMAEKAPDALADIAPIWYDDAAVEVIEPPPASQGRTSQLGIDLIKEFEGCKLSAYPDPGTGGDPWTIGYGHTGDDVYPGLVITQERAEELLVNDLLFFEQGVLDCVTVPLSQNQFDALVSFAYNIGVGAFCGSTMAGLLNEGNYQRASAQFDRWVNGGSGPMPGLVRRRAAERDLFLS